MDRMNMHPDRLIFHIDTLGMTYEEKQRLIRRLREEIEKLK